MTRIVLILTLVFSSLHVFAADVTPISDTFKNGDPTMLRSYMDTEIDLAIPGSSQRIYGDVAIETLKSFFATNRPTGFTVAHHADKSESGFLVGNLATSNGKYRVNVTYRTNGERIIIQSIRIE